MKSCNGLEVSICVDGKAVSEYDPPEHEVARSDETELDCPILRRFIEVEAGQNFVIRYRIPARFKLSPEANAVSVYFEMDGIKTGATCALHDKFAKSLHEAVQEGHHSKSSTGEFRAKYHFGTIQTTEDSSGLDLADLRKQNDTKGTIRVTVWQSHCVLSVREIQEGAIAINQPTPEKAIKGRAITLTAGLGSAEPVRRSSWYSSRDVGKGPLAVFIFEYRSRKSLQELMVIDQSPSPVPLTERDEESLTEAELRMLVKELRAKRAACSTEVMKQAKEEGKEENGNKFNDIVGLGRTNIKHERQVSPYDMDEVEEVQAPKRRCVATDVIEID